MANEVVHRFVNPEPDGSDTSITRPSNWNEDHDISGLLAADNTWTGINTFANFTTLGAINTTALPATGIGAAFSWNQSGGAAEVDIWNVFTNAFVPVSFSFKQLASASTLGIATVQADSFIAGRDDTTDGSQLLLHRTSTAASLTQQARIFQTESATNGHGQIHGSLDVIDGHGEHSNIFTQATWTNSAVGGANVDFLNNLNGSVWLKYTGANYEVGASGALFYVRIDDGLTNSSVSVIEIDTDVRATDVGRKVGIQIVDSDTSVGFGRGYDTGIIIGRIIGGRGYNYGVQFGYGLGAAADEILNAFFYCPSGTIPFGIDFSGVTFSTAAWKGAFSFSGDFKLQAAQLAANGGVATAMTNVGPVGSHTTVQEWMQVKGTGGATRWIPMF